MKKIKIKIKNLRFRHYLAALGLMLLCDLALFALVWCLSNPRLVSSFALAVTAHIKAGQPVLFEGDATQMGFGRVIGDFDTNSLWLAIKTRMIVPMCTYEGVTNAGNYPLLVAFSPLRDTQSVHVQGMAAPYGGVLILNERFIYDERWVDEREALQTLTHELIHFQRGVFVHGPVEELEAATQAATTEVLAGMCNMGDELACAAFWQSMEGYARADLQYQFIQRGWAEQYQDLADLLWRDRFAEAAARKSLRYWASDPEQLQYVLRAYALKPYKIVLDGILKGGFIETHGSDVHFDDSRDLTPGWLWHLLRWGE